MAITQFCKECGSKAVVTKTEREHVDFNRLYLMCKNPKCGHSWVSHLTFSHSTKESRLGKNGLVAFLVEKLPLEDLSELKEAIEQKQLALGL